MKLLCCSVIYLDCIFPIIFSSRIFINEALNSNEFLKNLQKVQIDEIVDSMYIRDFAKGQFICHEGDVGTQLYVLAGWH